MWFLLAVAMDGGCLFSSSSVTEFALLHFTLCTQVVLLLLPCALHSGQKTKTSSSWRWCPALARDMVGAAHSCAAVFVAKVLGLMGATQMQHEQHEKHEQHEEQWLARAPLELP